MALRVVAVRTAADRERFLRFPWRVYRGRQRDPHWVPPILRERRIFLDPAKGAFYQHADVQLLLALRGVNEVVGTISAHINHLHTQTHRDRVGFFGFFEVLNDPAAAAALLRSAANWLRERGCDTVRGPMNFSINDECGLLIDGFDAPPLAMMTYNPPRYVEYIEQAGFSKAIDLYAWTINDRIVVPDIAANGERSKWARVAERVQRDSTITFRRFDMTKFAQEVERGWRIYNAAWAQNWGAIPMTRAEFKHLTNNLKPFLDSRIMFFAEIDGETVGMLIAIPDANYPLRFMNGTLLPFGWAKFLWYKRQINTMRVLIMGVLPAYRRRGIDAMLYQKIKQAGIESGYINAEMSWILENNDVMNNTIANLGGVKYKTYRIYDLAL